MSLFSHIFGLVLLSCVSYTTLTQNIKLFCLNVYEHNFKAH